MAVPFLNLKAQYLEIKSDMDAAIHDVLNSTSFICGAHVKKFEAAFAKALNANYCIGTSSGTDSLHLCLWALGIGPGDEVIVPVNTFIATVEGVSLTGAKPVFVDHDPASFCIDVHGIENRITQRTRAILPVHLYGQPCDMDPILELAEKHRLFVVEDGCQAHLAEYKGKKVGTLGHAAAFSFFPGKNLGAYGEAGGVTTNDEKLYQKMLRIRNHGSVERYIHEVEGHNYRMEEIQGAVLNVKLPHLDAWTKRRRAIAALYREKLKEADGILCPEEMDYGRHVYHLFVIRVKKGSRDALRSFLEKRGIATGLHYPLPLHLQKAYAHLHHKEGDFPVAEKACREIVSLPMCPMMTDTMVDEVVAGILAYVKTC